MSLAVIPNASVPWLTSHTLTPADAAAMSALHDMAAPNKGRMRGIAARSMFHAIMNKVGAPEGGNYLSDTVAVSLAGGACQQALWRGKRSSIATAAGSTGIGGNISSPSGAHGRTRTNSSIYSRLSACS